MCFVSDFLCDFLCVIRVYECVYTYVWMDYNLGIFVFVGQGGYRVSEIFFMDNGLGWFVGSLLSYLLYYFLIVLDEVLLEKVKCYFILREIQMVSLLFYDKVRSFWIDLLAVVFVFCLWRRILVQGQRYFVYIVL